MYSKSSVDVQAVFERLAKRIADLEMQLAVQQELNLELQRELANREG